MVDMNKIVPELAPWDGFKSCVGTHDYPVPIIIDEILVKQTPENVRQYIKLELSLYLRRLRYFPKYRKAQKELWSRNDT